jgi:hypothetical protein
MSIGIALRQREFDAYKLWSNLCAAVEKIVKLDVDIMRKHDFTLRM